MCRASDPSPRTGHSCSIPPMATRRDFLSLGALTAAGVATGPNAFAQTADAVKQMKPPAKPVIVTRVTGDNTIQEAHKMLLDGADTLEAVHHVCQIGKSTRLNS